MDIQYSILQIDGHKLNPNCWNGIESQNQYPAIYMYNTLGHVCNDS